MKRDRDYTAEFQPTAQVWVAYFCGCSECPKGLGKTEAEAVGDLEEQCGYERSSATNYLSTKE